jgi:mono/diheme cytochrome c family protein
VRVRHAAALLLGAAAAGLAAAQPALHRYPDADLALGEQLLREHRCAACHVQKVGGDGSAIYRRGPPAGRVNSPAALLAMVQRCATELNLQLFPEDVAAIAGVLQRDHYRFPAQP